MPEEELKRYVSVEETKKVIVGEKEEEVVEEVFYEITGDLAETTLPINGGIRFSSDGKSETIPRVEGGVKVSAAALFPTFDEQTLPNGSKALVARGFTGLNFAKLSTKGFRSYDQGARTTLIGINKRGAHVNGEKGLCLIGGVPIQELAYDLDYTEMLHLLMHSNLPDKKTGEDKKFKAKLAKNAVLDYKLRQGLQRIAAGFENGAKPMQILGAFTSYLSDADPLPVTLTEQEKKDISSKVSKIEDKEERKKAEAEETKKIIEPKLEKMALRTTAVMPILMSMVHHHIEGKDLQEFKFPEKKDFFDISGDKETFREYDQGANLLNMMYADSKDKEMREFIKQDYVIESMNVMLNLHADHGQNASTFTAETISSTGKGVWGAITGAIHALTGPLHGGANVAVLKALREIDSKDKKREAEKAKGAEIAKKDDEIETRIKEIEEERIGAVDTFMEIDSMEGEDIEEKVNKYIDNCLKVGIKIPGVGHAVYKKMDPRAIPMKKLVGTLLENADTNPNIKKHPQLKNLFLIAKAIEKRVEEPGGHFSNKNISLNVDFYSGLGMLGLGVKEPGFTVLFGTGRVAGQASAIMDEIENSVKIYRPDKLERGPERRTVQDLRKDAEKKGEERVTNQYINTSGVGGRRQLTV